MTLTHHSPVGYYLCTGRNGNSKVIRHWNGKSLKIPCGNYPASLDDYTDFTPLVEAPVACLSTNDRGGTPADESIAESEMVDAKCVPDSPGEWHHRDGRVLRVWESLHPDQNGVRHLRGQIVLTGGTCLAGAHISEFASTVPVWLKAVPPTNPIEAVKTLRRLARDVHEACDKAGIPTHKPKMAAQHLPEPLELKERLRQLVEAVGAKDTQIRVLRRRGERANDILFCCPKCRGTHFGTQIKDHREDWIRQCNDQFGIGCRWSGKDADCMVSGYAAAHKLSGVATRLNAKLQQIGSLVQPKSDQNIVDAVKARIEEAEAFRTKVHQAAGCPADQDVIEFVDELRRDWATYKQCIHSLTKERDKLREEIADCKSAFGSGYVEERSLCRNIANLRQTLNERTIALVRARRPASPVVVVGDGNAFLSRGVWANFGRADHRFSIVTANEDVGAAFGCRYVRIGDIPSEPAIVETTPPMPNMLLIKRNGKQEWVMEDGGGLVVTKEGKLVDKSHCDIVSRPAA